MDLLQETTPFHPGLHRISVITTDLTEPEALIRQLVRAERETHPENFTGKTSCVYCKIPYVPPYETFRELRRLILRIRDNTGLRAYFRGVVAMEVTEWLGHEQEEYFTVLLKYLYDHRSLWQAALVLNPGTEDQTRRFLCACAGFITPHLCDISLFSRPDRLRDMLSRECARQGKRVTREAADMLAAALAEPEFRHRRSLTLIQRSAEELIARSGGSSVIRRDAAEACLTAPDSLLTLLAGKPLFHERRNVHDRELLQLRI